MASLTGRVMASASEPAVVPSRPAVSTLSFTSTGTPCRRPSNLALSSLVVHSPGDLGPVGTERQHRAEARTFEVGLANASHERLDELDRSRLASLEDFADLGERSKAHLARRRAWIAHRPSLAEVATQRRELLAGGRRAFAAPSRAQTSLGRPAAQRRTLRDRSATGLRHGRAGPQPSPPLRRVPPRLRLACQAPSPRCKLSLSRSARPRAAVHSAGLLPIASAAAIEPVATCITDSGRVACGELAGRGGCDRAAAVRLPTTATPSAPPDFADRVVDCAAGAGLVGGHGRS